VQRGSSRRHRALAALFVAAMGALLAAQTALAAVDWGPVREVSPAYAYNFGGSLARSTKDTTSYLHAAYTSTRIGGDFVDDNGPYAGVYYRRGNSGGSDWGTPKRLNPTGKHADYGTVIASGRNVYAAYVSYEHWINYDPAEPRMITVRTNGNHGAASAWLSRKIQPLESRVDRPAMAPWGTRGFLLTFTDADTGNIVLITCPDLTVEETGCFGGNVGTTTRLASNPDDGFEGLPVVAASGGTMAIAWLEAPEGGISLITKVTEGDWTDPVALTSEFADGLSAAARNGRFAFAWTEDDGVKLRMWSTSGDLETTSTVATVSSDGTYKAAYSTAVALAGTDTVGVAFAACRRADCAGGSSTGVDLRWRQSGNDGSTWGSASTVASYAASSARRINDFPSVVMSSATKRYLMFSALNASFTSYRVLLRVGTG
jgi:hypothetical protein